MNCLAVSAVAAIILSQTHRVAKMKRSCLYLLELLVTWLDEIVLERIHSCQDPAQCVYTIFYNKFLIDEDV